MQCEGLAWGGQEHCPPLSLLCAQLPAPQRPLLLEVYFWTLMAFNWSLVSQWGKGVPAQHFRSFLIPDPLPYCRTFSHLLFPPDDVLTQINRSPLLRVFIIFISTLLLHPHMVSQLPNLSQWTFYLVSFIFSCFYSHTSEVWGSIATKAFICEDQWDRRNSPLLLSTLLLPPNKMPHTLSLTYDETLIIMVRRQELIILCLSNPEDHQYVNPQKCFLKSKVPHLEFTRLKFPGDRHQESVLHWAF